MSKNKVLFEKGNQDMSGSMECDGTEEDVWDDRKLNDAYDKALKIANAEVAKRVAMSTNTQLGERADPNKNKKHTSKPGSSNAAKQQWKPGMPCRAVYDEDGEEYEAFVLRLIDEKECVVRYIGYDNCEVVPIASLKSSLGKAERQKQLKQASAEEDSDQEQSLGSTDASFQRKKKTSKKKTQKQPRSHTVFSDMPEMPFQLPNLSMMANVSSLELPLPPPPPTALPAPPGCEEQAVSSMLLSWYMSGYYTGLYQGMKRAKQGRRPV